MDIASELIVLAFLVLINAFFAAAEIALVSINDVRIKTLAERGDRRARLVMRITSDSTRFLATIQVGVTLAGFFSSATAVTKLGEPMTVLLTPLIGTQSASPVAFVIVTTIMALVMLILGELVPKRIALHYAEDIALLSVQPIYWLSKLTAPLVIFLSEVTSLILRLTGTASGINDEVASVDEIKALVDAARMGGSVGEQERRIIYGAVELNHIPARAIMVPRVQIQFLKATTSLEEARQLVAENAHTRLPVCDDDLDNIIGILHVKDLVRPMHELQQYPPTLRQLLRPAQYVSEHQSAAELLREMQKKRLHIVIVQDEFGGTAGLLTLEDVLEELVGEIRDEYDADEEREFERRNEHEWIFKIRASIATVNNEVNVQLPRDEAATLAGLFIEDNQQPPKAGDRITIGDITLEVLEGSQRVLVSRDIKTREKELW
ncbi:MAG: hemolysin family protein [Pseudanabaena sp. ELA607]|jgi:putative hemolysin